MEDNQQKKKVHITLVGGQAAPVYNGIVATNPELVEFIYSDKTAAVKDRVIREIDVAVAPSQPLSDNNLKEIMDRAKEVAIRYSDCDVTLNISGGLKPWSHFFAKIFAEHNENWCIFYIDQNNMVWDLTRLTSWQADIPMDVHRTFRLHGTPVASYSDIRDFNDADTVTMRTVDEMQKERRIHQIYKQLFAIDKEGLLQQVSDYASGCYTSTYDNKSYVEWETREVDGGTSTLVRIFLYDAHNYRYEYEIDSPHAVQILFTSGWYEYKVARALSRWTHAKDVWLNCKFRTKDGKEDKNEVDIIINTGTKLIFVECKTQIHSVSDMDKFCTVMKNYGGLASKGLFVTSWPKSTLAMEKCRDHHFTDIVLWKDSRKNMEKIYTILDNELKVINSR